MRNLNNLIRAYRVHTGTLIIIVTGEFPYWGELESWYWNWLISLHWQPMWIIIDSNSQLAQRASWGGRGDLYFVYRRIYGELLLIFVLYFNCHSNQKRIFKAAFFPPPSSDSIWGSAMYQSDFLFALHNSQAVYFLINQTSMMLYYCMHFNFFSRLKESMNLSELLIIFVNKVLITQTKGVLLYICLNMNYSYQSYSLCITAKRWLLKKFKCFAFAFAEERLSEHLTGNMVGQVFNISSLTLCTFYIIYLKKTFYE